MDKESREFLYRLLETPSPSGFESEIQKVVKKRVNKYADIIEKDVHGNLMACANPKGKIPVMLAGHCDQIGMMVTHIDDQGYIYFSQIGGLDPTVIPGSKITIHTEKGPLAAVIGNKPVHLLSTTERGQKLELKKMWIDIGAKNAKEAQSKVNVGDPITYELGALQLGEKVIASPGCDDRVGVFVVMEVLRLFSKKLKIKRNIPVALYAVSTVQEEVGLRGARTSSYGIDPVAGIAVDVTHTSDHPGVSAKEIGTVKLGHGPTIARGPNINHELGNMLIRTAKKKKIPFQPLGVSHITGTDANPIQVNKKGVAAALIGIPNRYMHTQVELIHTNDIENAIKLILETVMDITARTNFVPN
jgi:tetrahedral aminopeptidase